MGDIIMENKAILEKAIQKAIDGGHKLPDWAQGNLHYAQYALMHGNVYSVIFNHDFAKALWGDEYWEEYTFNGEYATPKPTWALHLQQMVISEDPIKYLGENI